MTFLSPGQLVLIGCEEEDPCYIGVRFPPKGGQTYINRSRVRRPGFVHEAVPHMPDGVRGA
ncbi:hypothetical protein J2046_002921 [Rhizobium petrolearium]|nr:hypothetical protein [Neorhizobium petrolearium]